MKKAGRIIEDEQDEIVKVLWKSYMMYFNYSGGWPILIWINLQVFAFVAAQMFGNYYTQKWAYSSEEGQHDKFWFYFWMIFGL